MDLAEGFNLTEEDVVKLLKDPSAETRADTATKVANQFDAGNLSSAARNIATDIFRVMVKDAEVMVRRALSENLKESADVPRDVALTLAKDVIDVSGPMLEFSKVLTDDDLVEIIQAKGADHQVAIAKRETVSERVSDALVETHNVDVVATLVANDGAEISETTFHKVIDEFGEVAAVNEPIVKRKQLPVTVAERMVNLVSESLREHLVTHHELSPDVAADLILQTRERATMSLLSPGSSKQDVQALVDQLWDNGRLTPTIILRAICTGDLLFFEAALAKRGQVPVPNAYILINDRGTLGFRRLYDKASMPEELWPAFSAAVAVSREMEYDGQPQDRERFMAHTIERVLTSFEAGEFEGEDSDFLIKKLNAIEATLDVV